MNSSTNASRFTRTRHESVTAFAGSSMRKKKSSSSEVAIASGLQDMYKLTMQHDCGQSHCLSCLSAQTLLHCTTPNPPWPALLPRQRWPTGHYSLHADIQLHLLQCKVINPSTSDRLDAYVELLMEKRKKRNLTPEQAQPPHPSLLLQPTPKQHA